MNKERKAMLDLIRKKQKSVLIKVVFWTIIAAFVGTIFLVWGKGSRGPGGAGVAIKVNGDKITFEEYRSVYENLRRAYQNVYRERFNPEMEKQLQLGRQAREGLIDQTLLLQEAERLDIKVSKKELVEAIANIPAFMRDGVFDRNQYLKVLQYERLTPEQFEQRQRRQMLIEKVREEIEKDVAVTAEEIDAEFRKRNEKANLAFVRVAPALYERKVEVTDKALEDYYAAHREEFRVAEKAALRYVKFDPDRYRKDLTLSDEDLQSYYRRHQTQFDVPEQVKASHILFRISADADEASQQKKRKLAEKVLAEVRAGDGKNFAELARRYSDDAGSAVQGGSLGYFTHGTMVPAFEEAAFALEPGQISDVVETSFGLHIIRCEGRIEAGIKPLAEVLDKVRDGLAAEQARQIAMDKAMTAYSKHRQTGDLSAAAEENGLTVEETGTFGRGEPITGIGNAPEVNAAAFQLKTGELARPVVLPQGIYLLALKERIESTIPELQEVRSAVERVYRREQSGELARKAAEQLLADLKGGKSLQQLVRSSLLQVEETGFFARTYGTYVPNIGNSAELAAAAFELDQEKPVADQVFAAGDQFIVVRFKERLAADPAKLDDATRENLEKVLLSRKRGELLENRLAALREKAEIRVDPALNNTMEGEL
jgi:peptidyl-prolyl cis-trans isomerase D